MRYHTAQSSVAWLLAIALGLFLSRGAVARELYDDPWVEARSPAFVVYSTLDTEETAELAQDLEDFGQLVTLLTSIQSTSARVPTYVFVFDETDESVGFSRDIAGLFIPTMRANYATARQRSALTLTLVLQHEYTHFLVHNNNALLYPRWFDEGVAELFSTATLRGGTFGFGDINKNRADWLMYNPWLSYTKVLDSTVSADLPSQQEAMFYAQSWALAHYLMMGPGKASFPTNMLRYLKLVESGEPEVAAFEQAFGERADRLGGRVRNYLGKARMMKGRLKQPFERSQIAVRPMGKDEIAAALGELALQYGKPEDSERYYRAALALNPNNTAAMVGVADHLKFAGKFDEAEPLYRKAVEQASASDNHRLDFGEYWLARAEAATDPGQSEQLLRLARQQFIAAHKLNENNPETLTIYASTFLNGRSDPTKALATLELANQLLPSNLDIKMQLAGLYVELNRGSDARPLLRSVIAWDHDGAEPARRMLEHIDKTSVAATPGPWAPSPSPMAPSPK